MALACVWMQLLKLRKTATSQGCKYDVLCGGMKHSTMRGKAARMAASVASLAWMLAMSHRRIHDCPSLPRVQNVVESGRELQDRGRRGPAVLRRDAMSALRPGMLGQDDVCLAGVHDLHQHFQRAKVHAEGDRECRGLLCVALQLGLLGAAAAPPDVMHREDTAKCLVAVHDPLCADRVLVHQPAQLNEQPVRVGLLQSRAVELFHALGRLLEAQAHPVEELPHPAFAWNERRVPLRRAIRSTTPLIVTALRHRTSVTGRMCSLNRVVSAGDSMFLLPLRLCSCRTPFPAVGSVSG